MPSTDTAVDTAVDTAASPTPTVCVALPGTGSDADFVRRAFGPAALASGMELVAVEPSRDLIGGYRAALDAVAAQGAAMVIGGVSIGAAVALDWALMRARSTASTAPCVGIWAALPAWSGSADGAVAAASAAATADALRRDGLDATVATMARTSPAWLAQELGRSWRALHPELVDQLVAAARYHAPQAAEIAELSVPLGVVAAADDPLHPLAVAQAWCAAAPRAALIEVSLSEWGEQPALLGHSCARAWRRAVVPD